MHKCKCLQIIFLICLLIASSTANAQFKNAWLFEGSYKGDGVANMTGGIKQGTTYLGFATLGMGFDFEKAELWKGGSAFVKGGNTHGGNPSEELIGDYQTVSNIEAGNHTFLQEMWYKQTVGQFEFVLGLQDLNTNFAVCDFACDFINSSFGIQSTFSSNLDIPIFPLTSLGLLAKWNITKEVSWLVAAFDGSILDWENNPYNIKWSISDVSFLFTTEINWHFSFIQNLDGNIKGGGYYHNESGNYGVYANINQIVWQSNEKQIEAFLQLSGSSPNINKNYLYAGIGCNLLGFFKSTHDDVLGLGIAHAHFSSEGVKHETTIELTYKYPVTENIYIQPDLQYIINPMGTDETLKNAFTGILRIGVDF